MVQRRIGSKSVDYWKRNSTVEELSVDDKNMLKEYIEMHRSSNVMGNEYVQEIARRALQHPTHYGSITHDVKKFPLSGDSFEMPSLFLMRQLSRDFHIYPFMRLSTGVLEDHAGLWTYSTQRSGRSLTMEQDSFDNSRQTRLWHLDNGPNYSGKVIDDDGRIVLATVAKFPDDPDLAKIIKDTYLRSIELQKYSKGVV